MENGKLKMENEVIRRNSEPILTPYQPLLNPYETPTEALLMISRINILQIKLYILAHFCKKNKKNLHISKIFCTFVAQIVYYN